MFIIVSTFNIGIILATQLVRGEISVAARSAALTQVMIPIIALVLTWWIGEFYDLVPFKFLGWYGLFTLVFYAVVFLLIMIGVDRYLGFSTMYLVFGYVLCPFPAVLVVRKIMKRYCLLLNRRLSRRERVQTWGLVLIFMTYWLIVPWDLSRLAV